MRSDQNAQDEFVKGADSQASNGNGEVTKSAQNTAFEFVKDLAAQLSEGSFELPPFPDTALKIRTALSDPDVDIDKVAQIVSTEPILCARLLRLANSALLHRGTVEITDLKTAISRLGFTMVNNAATVQAMEQVFSATPNSALHKYIDGTRRESITVATLAFMLVKACKANVNADEAMLAGLMHAIGKFYIFTRVDAFPELFGDEELLQELINDWHSGVGKAIVDSWGFPPALGEAIDEYEVLEREHTGNPDLTDVVLVANLLAKYGDFSDSEAPDISQIPACGKLKLDPEARQDLLDSAAKEIESMTSVFKG